MQEESCAVQTQAMWGNSLTVSGVRRGWCDGRKGSSISPQGRWRDVAGSGRRSLSPVVPPRLCATPSGGPAKRVPRSMSGVLPSWPPIAATRGYWIMTGKAMHKRRRNELLPYVPRRRKEDSCVDKQVSGTGLQMGFRGAGRFVVRRVSCCCGGIFLQEVVGSFDRLVNSATHMWRIASAGISHGRTRRTKQLLGWRCLRLEKVFGTKLIITAAPQGLATGGLGMRVI